MKQGLVVGKFMVLHSGHVALIRFAAAHCDVLSVIVIGSTHDPIAAPKRLEWLEQEFRAYVKIKAEILVDDYAQTQGVWSDNINRWAPRIKEKTGTPDLVFSSASFGGILADFFGVPHVPFDMDRQEVSISATDIMEHPFFHWDFVAPSARPYFVKRICFYGPESTGKSTMARRMAARFQTASVPEVAREFITTNQFTFDDMVRIGYAQADRVREGTVAANKILFCDTDLITTQIYSQVYLNTVPDILYSLEKETPIDYYFLFDVDVPWVADGLRDLGGKRQEMMEIFRNNLDQRGIEYTLISGTYEQRETRVMEAINAILAS